MTELLACPFCGGKPSIRTFLTESLWSHDQVTYTAVGCGECEIEFSSEPGYEIESPEAWNRRAALSSLRPAEVGSATTSSGTGESEALEVPHDLRDQRASLVARGVDPNLDTYLPKPLRKAPIMRGVIARWLPIAQADKAIAEVQDFPSIKLTLRNSERYWVRDADGRVFEASWTEGERNYWWDWEGESPVDPVEFMPHPLDPRWDDAISTSGTGGGE